MKILNLYAGIGGNRKLWGNEHQITAVERNKDIAKIYQDFYPNDTVIVGNAHKYLLEHYNKFDFIWSGPPCPSHSVIRTLKNNCDECIKKYPNMMLYEEIIYLKHFFKGKFVVENVISYYDPLIKPYECENHYFWSNFYISKLKKVNRNILDTHKTEQFGINLNDYNLPSRFKVQLLNNMVNPTLGLYILNSAFNIKQYKILEYE